MPAIDKELASNSDSSQAAMSDQQRSASEQARERRREEVAKHDQPPFWEWFVAAIGLALVVSAIGFMLYRAIKGNSSPPEIAISVDSVKPTDNGFLVTFRVINRGELTAASLTVEGELRSGTESVETTAVTLNYVPSRSERRGGLFFTNDPQKFQLMLRAKGYERP